MTSRFPILLCLILCNACDGGDDDLAAIEISGAAMGTQYNLTVVDVDSAKVDARLAEQIDSLLQDIEQQMSTYRPDSEISRFNRGDAGQWIQVSTALCNVVDSALDIGRRTGGAFDITVGPVVNLWGFGPGEIILAPPDQTALKLALSRVGYDKVETDCSIPALKKADPDVYVDLSAYAKGYGVDRIAAFLDEAGVSNYLVEIGGELKLRGHNSRRESWRVAIEKPLSGARQVHSILRVTDSAVATSGDYRNFFVHEGRRYSHTIDPRTGLPVEHDTAAVTVVNASAADADALATALLVLGATDGMHFAREEDIAAIFLVRNGDVLEAHKSPAYVKVGET